MTLNIRQLIDDESNDREYFAMLPTMLWPDIKLASSKDPTTNTVAAHAQELGAQLDVYDKWLYATIKRVCGEKGSQCFLSTRGLAKLAGMSVGQVSKSKAKLEKAGLITIISKKRSAHGQAIDHITVVDVWERNVRTIKARQSAHQTGCSQDEQQASERSQGEQKPQKCSPHELKCSQDEQKPQKCSPHELKCSQGEPEEEPIEEEPEGEEKQVKKNADPLSLELHRKTQEARERAGGNWADTSEAGGADSLADHLITTYCQLQGQAMPRGKTLGNWRRAFNEVLRGHRLQNDGTMAERGLRVLLDPNGEFTFQMPTYNPCKPGFKNDYSTVLGRLLDGGDGYSEQFKRNKQKGALHGPRQRCAARDDPNYRIATAEEAAPILAQIEADKA